jgi:hypothetical protein
MLKSITFLFPKHRNTSSNGLVTLPCNRLLLSTTLSSTTNLSQKRKHGFAYLTSLFLGIPKSLALNKNTLPSILMLTPWGGKFASTIMTLCLGSLFIPNTLNAKLYDFTTINNKNQVNFKKHDKTVDLI